MLMTDLKGLRKSILCIDKQKLRDKIRKREVQESYGFGNIKVLDDMDLHNVLSNGNRSHVGRKWEKMER